jgi:hypothetical protein
MLFHIVAEYSLWLSLVSVAHREDGEQPEDLSPNEDAPISSVHKKRLEGMTPNI